MTRFRKRTRTAPMDGVGYGNPPVHTRFQVGKSGNPKGRPPGSLQIDAIVEQSLKKPVSVTRNGAAKSIPLLQAIVEKLTVDAAKGDNAARKLVLQLNEQRELASADRHHVSDRDAGQSLDPVDEEILEQFRQETLAVEGLSPLSDKHNSPSIPSKRNGK